MSHYLYLLYNEIMYDPYCNNYYNILTLNKQPEGMLKPYTKLMSLTKPYTGDLIRTQCSIVINNSLLNNKSVSPSLSSSSSSSSILTLDDLNEFTEFLINNNYVITDYNNNNNNNNNNSNNNSKKIIYSFKITL